MSWILAYRYNDKYIPESVYEKQEQALEGLEYEDVKNGTFQLWEYPSGSMFTIQPDREVPRGKEWSLAADDTWLPKAILLGNDEALVAAAYKKFQ